MSGICEGEARDAGLVDQCMSLAPDVRAFCARLGILSDVPVAVDLVRRAFPTLQDVQLEAVEDPETDDAWLLIDIMVAAEIDDFLRQYDRYTEEWIASVSWPESTKIRLAYNLIDVGDCQPPTSELVDCVVDLSPESLTPLSFARDSGIRSATIPRIKDFFSPIYSHLERINHPIFLTYVEKSYMEKDRALTRAEAALRLGISPVSLYSPHFRARIGLPAVKIGRSLRFLESDVERLLAPRPSQEAPSA